MTKFLSIEVVDKTNINKIKNKYQNEINFAYQINKENDNILFPLKSNLPNEATQKIIQDEDVVLKELQKFSQKTDHIKKEKIGKILIIKDQSISTNFELLNSLLSNENAETVLFRDPKGSNGEFKLTKYFHIFGKDSRETIYEENNIKFKIDLECVFYSSKMFSDRKRISKMVKKDETVLICYCGHGEFICYFYKQSKKIIGIDSNKKAIEYAKHNLKMNNMEEKSILLEDDIFKIDFNREKFDRIVIPQLLFKDLDLTKKFIDHLSNNMKNNSMIHIYDHLKKNEIHEKKEKIIEWFKENDHIITISYYLVGNIGINFYRICFDIKIIGH
eukprot:gene6785-10949_t